MKLCGAKTKYNLSREINRFFIVINSILLLISCQNEPKNLDKSIFRYNSASGITSLDPAYARTQENIRIVNQVFNGLIQLDKDLNLIPAIAKSWNIDSSGLVYTFKLRNGVFFHKHPAFGPDSTRSVTASDFVYSFSRILDSKIASDGAWIFNGTVRSEEPFIAINDSTLRIHLERPFGSFLGILSMAYCYVVPEEVCNSEGDEFGKRPIGTGPFQFANWKEGVKLNLIRNPNYFEASSDEPIPYLDAISVSFIQNKQTELLEMRQGNLDAFSGLESSYIDDILSSDGQLTDKYNEQFVLKLTPFLNTEFLAFQTQKPGLSSDKDFRLAVNHAINKKAMIKYLRNNVGHPSNGGFTPMGLPGHTTLPDQSYDPELAKAYLDKSGYEPGNTLILHTTKEYLDMCILVQKNLEKIGVLIKIEVIPSSLLRQLKSSGDLTFFRGSWIADYPDAENYMACFYSENEAPNGPNYCRFLNTRFDSCYQELLRTNKPEDKRLLVQAMENILMAESPVVILFYDQSVWIHANSIQGIRINALNHIDLRYTRKEN